VALALDAFGDRWSLLIIRDIIFRGSKFYKDFLGADEKIATNILVDRLKFLVSIGILRKSQDPDSYRSYIYKLTDKGRDLVPVILEMIRWSGKYYPDAVVKKQFLDRIENDKEALLSEIYSRLADKQDAG